MAVEKSIIVPELTIAVINVEREKNGENRPTEDNASVPIRFAATSESVNETINVTVSTMIAEISTERYLSNNISGFVSFIITPPL